MSAPADRYVPALAYRWLTPAYDVVVRTTTREATFKAALLDQAGLQPRQRVLDLACGTATLTIAAKQRVPAVDIVALDGDAAILARARAKAAAAGVAIRFDEGLSHALPYADASFDRVLCSLFFHHLSIDAKRAAFAEVARVLKPGGELHGPRFDIIQSMKVSVAVTRLYALAQESRLAIFRLLVQAGPEGLCVGDIGARLKVAAPTLSFHLKELTSAGLLRSRQEGRFIYYSAAFKAMNELLGYLTENCCGGEPCVDE